jgi:hypothetical protein
VRRFTQLMASPTGSSSTVIDVIRSDCSCSTVDWWVHNQLLHHVVIAVTHSDVL